MLRVPVEKIEPGMVLARPIPLPQDPRRYLLRRDVEIPMDLVPWLNGLRIPEVWVRNRELEFLEDLIDEDLADHQREVYLHVRRNFEAILRDSTAEIDLVHFEQSISELFSFLLSAGSDVLLQKLDAFDNYLMSHSTNVCYLAMLLGMKLQDYLAEERRQSAGRETKNLQMLSLGCLLHDVGKMRVPKAILNKPGRLTPAEMDEMRRHALHGHEMVKRFVPAAVADVVLHHHQRFDGTGYPARVDRYNGEPLPPLAGRQIPVFARIAMVADVYDAATSRRCYSPAKPPIRALYEMHNECRGFFDPVIAAAFFRTVPAFPIGQSVTLTDGVEAVVVDFRADCPTRPKVQCLCGPGGRGLDSSAAEEIDLALYSDVGIASVNGEDVRKYVAALEAAECEPLLA